MLRLVETPTEGEQESTGLDELAREGARRMLQRALEEEVTSYIESENEVDGDGRSLVVRNGKAKARKVTPGAVNRSIVSLPSGRCKTNSRSDSEART